MNVILPAAAFGLLVGTIATITVCVVAWSPSKVRAKVARVYGKPIS